MMKMLGAIVVIGFIAFGAMRVFTSHEATPTSDSANIPILIDRVFAPLDADDRKPAAPPLAEVRKLREIARDELRKDPDSAWARDMIRLCDLLMRACEVRARSAAELEDLRNRPLQTLRPGAEAETRQFFEMDIQRRWHNYVRDTLPAVERLRRRVVDG